MKQYLLWLLIPLIALFMVGCDQLGLEDDANLKTVYVGPEKVGCEGEGPQTCYLIKENPEDEWSLYYFEIEGFDYESGYEYVLIISENSVENPPAGGSSLSWKLEEVVSKTPATGSSTDQPAESTGSEPAEEEEASVEVPAQTEFVPIAVEELGVSTVAPADWPKIEDDPLLKDAWGPGQYRFIAFHSTEGDDVQEAMATLLSTTAAELLDGTIDGEYWEEEVGGYSWAMYAVDNPDVGLAQTVSMTEQDGTIYIVSLFIESNQKDSVLQPVLENFAIESNQEASETESEEDAGTELVDFVDTGWVLTTYYDGSGQLVNVLPGVEATALFAADGRLSGSASCNNYVSLYTAEDGNLTISLPAMTRKECDDPPGVMIQETGYLGNLTAAVSYRITGNELQLLDEDGRAILTYLAS